MNLDGGSLNAGSLVHAGGTVNLNMGSLNLNGAASYLGAAATVGDGGAVNASLRLSGGDAQVGALTLASNGVLHLKSGQFFAESVDATSGAIQWDRGQLHLLGGNSLAPGGLAVPDFGELVGRGDWAGPVSGAHSRPFAPTAGI